MGEVSRIVDKLTGPQAPSLIPIGGLLGGKYEVDLTGQEQQEFFLIVRVWRMRALALS